ncbi:MAG TPA: metallophosphoesterase, partial [Chitinophagaceae bacterium]|nr:metallophosphoesterase [Chitinophagaceae bacterium]
MGNIHKRFSNQVFICALLVLSCLLHRDTVNAQNTSTEIASRIIIIGDAGKLHNGKNNVTDAVSRYIHPADEKTTIVFAGDNIYPKGLPEKEDKTYESQAGVLRTLLLSFKNYKASVYVIPGNHDWQKGGPKGWETIKRQENFVTELGEKNISFLPLGGCPGPEELPLSDSVTMVIMDTQWWLHAGEKPGASSDCDCKTENEVLEKLADIAYRNKNKRIIFVAHHPLRSHGEHGGYYTLKQHIFPFTDLKKNAYIPLPVIGSIYPLVRGKFGNVEDLPHPLYKDMIKSIEQSFSEVADVTYVGGHEHNLQLIREGKRNYIVSGSGTNRDRVKKGKNSLYASDENGFTEIIYTKGGQQRINYFTVNDDTAFQLAYSFDVPYITIKHEVSDIDSKNLFADSITIAIAPQYDAAGKIHRIFFGEHYRKIWATPVTMSIFHIEKEMGGLKILKKGGGQQTKSLRLEDKNGKQWVLRTIQKNPEKALPANLKSTIAKPIVQDQTSAANPYAAVTVPTLADAAGVPHTSPRIVYIPDDPALGVYRSEFAKTICLFEEREPGNEETYSTQKVLDKLQKDADNTVDEKAVLRARMLDLLIGDWDRHEDQWRWTKTESGKKNIYSPIPRDRDQVYYINTGILPYIAGRDWLMPKLQGFGPTVTNVQGFMFNARYFDRLFLHQLAQKDWEEVIASLQQSLTNEVIEQSVQQLPDSVYKQIGQRIIRDLISRRNKLMQYGLDYYRFLSKTVDIPGSDKKEVITIQSDSTTRVVMQKLKKDGSAGDTIYSRTFTKETTKEIRLYGRDGADHFIIENSRKPAVKIRLIGGDGDDSFYVHQNSKRNRLLIYDRSDKKNTYPDHRFARQHLSQKNEINDYNPRSFKYNRLAPMATAGYNLDDGLLLGLGGVYTRQGFRKEPYASRHRIIIGGAFATGASFVKYKGDITGFV